MSSRQSGRYVGPYTVVHSRPVYENPWLKLREDQVTRRNEEGTFAVVTMKPGVSVLPMDAAGDVHLVKEFKYAIGDHSLEVVSGGIESGETPEQAALRELGEEAGLVASEWVDMGVLNPFTTIVSSPNHMFLARELRETRRALDKAEEVEVVKLPFDEAVWQVLNGTITHGASCALILKTHLFLERRREKGGRGQQHR
jgi:ADP-ribose pyrophosphatase